MKKIIGLLLALLLVLPGVAGAISLPSEAPTAGSDPRLTQALEALSDITSAASDIGLNIGMDMGGMSMNMGINMFVEFTEEPAALHGSLNMDMFGERMDMEFFVLEENGEEVAYYMESSMSLGDETPYVNWERSVNDSDILIFGDYSGYTTDFVDYSPLQLDEAASADGQLVFSGDLLSSDWNRNMLQFSLMGAAAFAEGETEVLAIIEALKTAEGGLPMTVAVSEETGLPTALSVDVSGFANRIMQASMGEEMGAFGMEDMGVTCALEVTLRDVNTLAPIELPEEAAALRGDADIGEPDAPGTGGGLFGNFGGAGSIGIIGGADGPTAVIGGDDIPGAPEAVGNAATMLLDGYRMTTDTNMMIGWGEGDPVYYTISNYIEAAPELVHAMTMEDWDGDIWQGEYYFEQDDPSVAVYSAESDSASLSWTEDAGDIMAFGIFGGPFLFGDMLETYQFTGSETLPGGETTLVAEGYLSAPAAVDIFDIIDFARDQSLSEVETLRDRALEMDDIAVRAYLDADTLEPVRIEYDMADLYWSMLSILWEDDTAFYIEDFTMVTSFQELGGTYDLSIPAHVKNLAQ